MNALLRDREEIDRLSRSGIGVTMGVRWVRPSARGTRSGIADGRLVDLVCIEGKASSDMPKAHGGSTSGKTVTALAQALDRVPDRMAEP